MIEGVKAVACFALVLAGLAAMVALARQPVLGTNLRDLGPEDAGRLVLFSGGVAAAREAGGTWFISLCSWGKCATAILPKQVAERVAVDLQSLEKGQLMRVEGVFDGESINVLKPEWLEQS